MHVYASVCVSKKKHLEIIKLYYISGIAYFGVETHYVLF
jgi:hypothetical protein